MTQKLFGTDGVRGKANVEPITPESAVRLARAAASVLGDGTDRRVAVLGRDTRASGEMLTCAIAAGLAGAGFDVIDVGMVPTPAVAFLARDENAAFGVAISASHNPFEDNGIKFFGANGYKLSDFVEQRIERKFFGDHSELLPPAGTRIGRIKTSSQGAERYTSFAVSTFPKGISLSNLRLVIDAANGAGFETTPSVLSRLGANVRLENAAPNGFNINDRCGSTHPQNISELVRSSHADAGIAHDGDADRVLFCDETGDPLDGDELLAIIAVDRLSRAEWKNRGVAATIMSNLGLDHLITSHGGHVIRTAVGDRYVMDAMVKHGLTLGGEQSGHIIIRDKATTGDGLITALEILAIMAKSGKPLSALRKVLSKFPQVQRDIRVREKRPFAEFPELTSALEAAELRLGQRGRIVLRYSGTEPKARLLLEGPDERALIESADSLSALIVRLNR